MARKRENLEFRYYDIPHGEPLLALYGEDWIRPYGYDKNFKTDRGSAFSQSDGDWLVLLWCG